MIKPIGQSHSQCAEIELRYTELDPENETGG